MPPMKPKIGDKTNPIAIAMTYDNMLSGLNFTDLPIQSWFCSVDYLHHFIDMQQA